MATYCPEDLASRELCCPICFEDYDIQDARRAPKLLLCLHTFCYECARKLWQRDGSLECSLCRMLHEEVTLDDLLDNHVIVQHLRREFEERDLELARRIDQELRDQDSSVAPASAHNGREVIEDREVVEVSSSSLELVETTQDITQDTVDTRQDLVDMMSELEDTSTEMVNTSQDLVNSSSDMMNVFSDLVDIEAEQDAEDEEEEEEEEERDFILSNFIGELMEGINPQQILMTQMGEDDDNESDNDDQDENADDDNDAEDHEDDQEIEAYEEQEESDDHHEEEENTNPFFSLNNIHSLLGETEEESDNESSNRDENASNIFPADPIHTVLSMNENEENDDDDDYDDEEEEEDERWHSASDDIINVCCADHEGLPMSDDINEMEDETPDIFDWHIITSESLMDD